MENQHKSDEFIRKLVRKQGPEKAPDNFTDKVMSRIKTNPVIDDTPLLIHRYLDCHYSWRCSHDRGHLHGRLSLFRPDLFNIRYPESIDEYLLRRVL